MGANELEPHIVSAILFERLQLFFKRFVRFVDRSGDDRKILRRRRRGDSGSRGHQCAGMPGNPECSSDFRYRSFIDPVLGVTHPVEGKPPNDAGRNREHHGPADSCVKLG